MPEAGRVIGGRARGIRLEGPHDAATRPLTGRVKESLFGSLEAEGALAGPFLDLFAGTGAGGIEALSRGAPGATFVERSGGNCAVIAANLRRTRLDGGRVVRAKVEAFLGNGRRAGEPPYLCCLLDPPYGDLVILRALELLGDEGRAWLATGALVAAKHFWRDELPGAVGVLVQARQRRYGETALTFYTRTEEAA